MPTPVQGASSEGVRYRTDALAMQAQHDCSSTNQMPEHEDRFAAAARRDGRTQAHGVMALAVEMTVKLSELGQRSDADIAAAAKNVLVWSSSLHADTVKVMVEGGWLTLSGDVEWQFQRQDAANSVRHLAGVTGVSNQITIKPPLSALVVKSDIEAALKRRAATDAKTIAVDVQGADVTLTGTVHSWAERDLATRSAWGSVGVRNVVDKMNLVY